MTHHNEAMEIANARLRLRRGLRFELQEHGGKAAYVIHDESNGSFFQLGIPEYAFVSLLDGSTSIEQAVQQTAARLGEDAFTMRSAIATSQWLLQNQLVDAVDATNTSKVNVPHLLEQRRDAKKAKRVAESNPLFTKIPLGNPQPLLQAASRVFGWMTTTGFFFIWLVALLVAGGTLFQNAANINQAFLSVLAPSAWIWLGVTFVGLKIAHEVAHGIFCLRYGGNVPETGLVFILFVPIPYVDVTSCWGFSSKWQRIVVSSAGMYVELFLASLAAIAWSWTNDPVTKFHLFNVVLSGSITTVLFNANFLMRFDGYYILSDLIGIPNLAQSGQQFVQYLGKRYLLGLDVRSKRHRVGDSLAIKAYGITAFCWRIFICVSLSILATALFYGFGVALAIFGIAVWIGIPMLKLAKMFVVKSSNETPSLRRVSLVTVPALAVFIGAMFIVPWPFEVSAPGIVQFKDPAIVRTEVNGFAWQIDAVDGQLVERGEVLVRLENPELASRLIEVESDLQMSRIRGRQYHSEGNIASWQAEIGAANALEQKATEIRGQQSALVIRAPRSGMIVAENLESLTGRYLERGEPILQIVDADQKEILASISQEDYESFSDMQGESLEFAPHDAANPVSGTLVSVKPGASRNVDIRLTSFARGPLAVRPSDANSESANQSNSVELLYPRFEATLDTSNLDPTRLPSGTIGNVRLGRYSHSLAGHITIKIRHWIESSLRISTN